MNESRRLFGDKRQLSSILESVWILFYRTTITLICLYGNLSGYGMFHLGTYGIG